MTDIIERLRHIENDRIVYGSRAADTAAAAIDEINRLRGLLEHVTSPGPAVPATKGEEHEVDNQ